MGVVSMGHKAARSRGVLRSDHPCLDREDDLDHVLPMRRDQLPVDLVDCRRAAPDNPDCLRHPRGTRRSDPVQGPASRVPWARLYA